MDEKTKTAYVYLHNKILYKSCIKTSNKEKYVLAHSNKYTFYYSKKNKLNTIFT